MTKDTNVEDFEAVSYSTQAEYHPHTEHESHIEYNPQIEYNPPDDYDLDPAPDFPEDEDLKDTIKDNVAASAREESVREGSLDPSNEKDDAINYEFEEIYMEHEHYSHTWANYTDEWNPNGLRMVTDDDAALRRISAPVPKITYVLALVEFAERGSYYGLTNVISNFVQFPLPKGGNGWGATPKNSQLTAGALDQGLMVATALTLVLNFLSYLTPLLGAYLADARYGRYPTIWAGTIVCGIGHVIIVIAGVPGVIEAQKASLGLFIAGLIIFAFGTGLFKPNLLPLVMEQYREDDDWVKTLPSGEQVVITRETTLQRMTLVYYWAVNVGGFLGLGTAYAEKRIGYWLAFLVPTILYFFLPALLYIIRNMVYKVPSSKNSIIAGFCGVIYQYIFRKKSTYPPKFVHDVWATLKATMFFLFYPVYFINDNGIGALSNSQGASMITNGVPNDLINNFNPLTIIVCVPIVNYGLYPLLRKLRWNFRASFRIFLGFMFAAFSPMIGAILQWQIYETSPCGYYATDCEAGVAPITIWWQVFPYFCTALSEIFAITTSYELAYHLAPYKLRSIVLALLLFMSAISTAIQTGITPALKDPYLIWPFVGICCAGVVFAIAFIIIYWKLGKGMSVKL
ncbi:Peptide transporter PTR2 [Yarrowia sp. C11]|nr:Peptide transporter PTR2 [Yarrowia sp. C11]KAG5371029.1 Peptide transporter PTR2 [Yarrowia sp. E02]